LLNLILIYIQHIISVENATYYMYMTIVPCTYIVRLDKRAKGFSISECQGLS